MSCCVQNCTRGLPKLGRRQVSEFLQWTDTALLTIDTMTGPRKSRKQSPAFKIVKTWKQCLLHASVSFTTQKTLTNPSSYLTGRSTRSKQTGRIRPRRLLELSSRTRTSISRASFDSESRTATRHDSKAKASTIDRFPLRNNLHTTHIVTETLKPL